MNETRDLLSLIFMNTMHYQIKQKLIKLDVKVSLRSNAYVKNVITSTNVAVISLIFMGSIE